MFQQNADAAAAMSRKKGVEIQLRANGTETNEKKELSDKLSLNKEKRGKVRDMYGGLFDKPRRKVEKVTLAMIERRGCPSENAVVYHVQHVHSASYMHAEIRPTVQVNGPFTGHSH
ncbi:hypothetical protein Fmac_027304 [Flemingia macrophylla]|uniref:Uncharacterized protein n=1 Tax=Flemingia macrophylla TaxID=520843 RepID=A0ABD1LIZ9_9FABA